jgi:hypothetical protein
MLQLLSPFAQLPGGSDDGLAVRGQRDVVDAADGRSPDLDLVPLDQLPGVEEVSLDGVTAAATREQQDRNDNDGSHHRADCSQPSN